MCQFPMFVYGAFARPTAWDMLFRDSGSKFPLNWLFVMNCPLAEIDFRYAFFWRLKVARKRNVAENRFRYCR